MSEALQMADELDRLGSEYDSEIAAELRRLHDLVTEDSILQRRQRDEIAQLGQALARAIERINELEALNAELVEALRKCDEAMTWELGGEPLDTLMTDARNAARAALAKAEANK